MRPRGPVLLWVVAAIVTVVVGVVVALVLLSRNGGDDAVTTDGTSTTAVTTTVAGNTTTSAGDTTTVAGTGSTTTATTTGDSTTTTAPDFYVDEPVVGPLKRHDRGSRVQALQTKLNDLGYREGAPDGKFGPVTEQAVKKFQADNGLTADGLVGPQTSKKLGLFYPKAVPPDQIPSIAASTTNTPSGSVDYEVDNVLDGKSETAWQSEGGAPPEDNTLTFDFDGPMDIKQLAIYNGYEVPSRNTQFDENSRVKELKITSGAQELTVTLDDDKDPQTVDLNFGPIDTLTLTIVSVYPGNHYTEVAITDIMFLVDGTV